MIHGIYTRSRPTNKWHLVGATLSPEIANQNLADLRKQAQLTGSQTEVAVQLFEDAFHIPEYLTEVKDRKPLYN